MATIHKRVEGKRGCGFRKPGGLYMVSAVSAPCGKLPTPLDICPTWGIFHAFKPSAIEYVVHGGESADELERLEKRGITLVDVEKEPIPAAAGPWGDTRAALPHLF